MDDYDFQYALGFVTDNVFYDHECIFKTFLNYPLQAIPIPLSKASNVNRIFNLASKKLGFEFATLNPGMVCLWIYWYIVFFFNQSS